METNVLEHRDEGVILLLNAIQKKTSIRWLISECHEVGSMSWILRLFRFVWNILINKVLLILFGIIWCLCKLCSLTNIFQPPLHCHVTCNRLKDVRDSQSTHLIIIARTDRFQVSIELSCCLARQKPGTISWTGTIWVLTWPLLILR